MRRWVPLFTITALMAQGPAQESSARVEARLRKEVTYLASPALKGRGNGYPELEKAAQHVASELKALGLKVTLQRFPFIATVVREQAEAILAKGEAERPLVWGKDIEALGFSGDAEFRNKPLAFVGYGLQIPGGYDDLAGLELRGRVAILSRSVPDLPAFAHLGRGERSLLARLKKLEMAKVAGVVVLEDGLRPLQREEGPVKVDLSVVGMTASALAEVCGDLKARLKRIEDTGQPQSQDFVIAPWSTLSLSLKLRREEVQLPNVVAELRGRDPKLRKEFIVLGAHMDHLGLGERHSMGGAAALGQIHPGADDNASGTATVVELARELKMARPRRSILVECYAAEEEGLLGSQYWVQHPTHPLESVKFMLNFDMVGRLDGKAPKLMIAWLGAPKSAMDELGKLAPKGWTISPETGAMAGGSDHMSFAQAKIPTFFFFTGLHGEYHRPTDTSDRINFAGMATLAAFGKAVVLDLANAEGVPAFDPETAKMPARAEGGPMRIAFGVIPDYAENAAGFRINGVSAGLTAEAIGLRAGDIIVQFGDRPIKNIYDYMGALGAYKPGDKAVVQWLREGQPMQAEAILRGRN